MADKDRLGREAEFDNFLERLKQQRQTERDTLATVRRFNAIISSGRRAWFWPKVGAALTAKHPWAAIACDSCGIVNYLDLRMKPRDPEASIRVALRDVRCPRCNGHGRPRIVALAQRAE
jgi:hypothetical protein